MRCIIEMQGCMHKWYAQMVCTNGMTKLNSHLKHSLKGTINEKTGFLDVVNNI